MELDLGQDDGKQNDIAFNLDPTTSKSFHCGASEDMLDISIESGMYMTVNTPDIQGVMKFTGAMAILCTNSADPDLIGKWIVPVEEYHTTLGPQLRIIDSIFDRDSSDIASVFSGITWRASRESFLTEFPDHIKDVVNSAPVGINVVKPDNFDEFMYVEWQETSTEEGYAREKARLSKKNK